MSTLVQARIERRWPAALLILATMVLLRLLPNRVRLLPSWIPYLIAVAALAPMLCVALAKAKTRWLQVEHAMMVLVFVLIAGGNLLMLAYLVDGVVHGPSSLGGLQLLASSVALWVTNVLSFSLLYWQIDAGGPEARANHETTQTEWIFPEASAPGVPADWRPAFIDYFFLGFSTAAAFSPTHALPFTRRAKVLMMLESSISLATLVVVAARAINILGS